jgi:ATP-dependent RNA helicase DDX51/DBP6
VASDGMSRGMDFPCVNFVVNYDMPAHIRTYVHRAGRTARAGTSGHVFTLLRSEHRGAFQHMMRSAGNGGVEEFHLDDGAWVAVEGVVETALRGAPAQVAAV